MRECKTRSLRVRNTTHQTVYEHLFVTVSVRSADTRVETATRVAREAKEDIIATKRWELFKRGEKQA
jgi:hypothetical protein